MRVKAGGSEADLSDVLADVDVASQRRSCLDRLEVMDWELFRLLLVRHLL